MSKSFRQCRQAAYLLVYLLWITAIFPTVNFLETKEGNLSLHSEVEMFKKTNQKKPPKPKNNTLKYSYCFLINGWFKYLMCRFTDEDVTVTTITTATTTTNETPLLKFHGVVLHVLIILSLTQLYRLITIISFLQLRKSRNREFR